MDPTQITRSILRAAWRSAGEQAKRQGAGESLLVTVPDLEELDQHRDDAARRRARHVAQTKNATAKVLALAAPRKAEVLRIARELRAKYPESSRRELAKKLRRPPHLIDMDREYLRKILTAAKI